ncbi:SCF E3 ubiquitin ligase complex F-box protein grrA [Tetrabaena socialis]|uniref:SCF E3 ubiquitin ligase complex F-box protein grrA n=1 Tax=Tetrabaena socialis TaxID=47790 RepID=A0A2J7ZTW6_9CHLO|nr:SCF E3 ubiquitin ligase complex F-box protein grrA [Tetrabaena socialis]|eukprot:PNH03680.1 SCF E3 ubiquitin ligase complex F-box protein grrA [Tetrabaena socialis]
MSTEGLAAWQNLPFDCCQRIVDAGSRAILHSPDAPDEEELFVATARSIRLVCAAWRDAGASSVVRLRLGGLGPLSASRPLAAVFPELRCLDLSAFGGLRDEGVALLGGCRGLEKLQLAAPGLTAAGLQAVSAMFPVLRCFWLGVAGSDAVTEEGLTAVAAGLPGLMRLELQGCSRLRNERLGPLLGRMGRLRHLDLSNCLNLLDSCLTGLASLSSLASLKMRGCWKVSGEGLGVLAPPALQLRFLDLSECKVTDAGLHQVATLTSLTRLYLARSWDVRAPGLAALSRLTRLAVLDLSQTNTDNTGVAEMSVGLTVSLTDLDLSATLINRHGVCALAAALPRLRRLKLNKCPGLDDDALLHLASLSCLRRLHVRHCRNLSDSAATGLAAALPRLQHFELDGCWAVAMATMDRLYGRPHAEWRRAGDGVDDEGGGWEGEAEGCA